MQEEENSAPENEAIESETAENAAPVISPELQKIAELEAQLASYKDQALRAMAEAENTRKRATREMEDTSRYAVSNFARDIVGVVENLQRASSHITPAQRENDELLKTLAEGVDMVMKELLATLTRYGVVRVGEVGEKFDHNTQQAVAQVETMEHPPGVVTQVLQAGYVIHDRLLRPAMVSVSKAPKAA